MKKAYLHLPYYTSENTRLSEAAELSATERDTSWASFLSVMLYVLVCTVF